MASAGPRCSSIHHLRHTEPSRHVHRLKLVSVRAYAVHQRAVSPPDDPPCPLPILRLRSIQWKGPTNDLPDAPASAPRSAERGITVSLAGSWHRISLLAIVIVAAMLNFWGLSKEGYDNQYYAAAVKSMSLSWHNFFFNSFDPGGFVTIDKPPLGFWFQVASVKLFGFSGTSLLLPEALAGVLSVLVLYRLVARSFGRVAGLIAALGLAITPISVLTARNNTIDSILVLTVLLGAWAVLKAAETGRLRWLLVCALAVGLGFNIKMLEAYLVLPAFGLVYLLGARVGLGRRLVHLVLAGLVLLVVSFSWITAVDLTPAADRPWVDSTTTNSELDLAVGYNGLQRLTGNSGVGNHGAGNGAAPGRGATGASGGTGTTAKSTASTGAQSSIVTLPASSASTSGSSGSTATGAGLGSGTGGPGSGAGGPGGNGGGPGGIGENGPTGVLRLLDTQLGSQIGWLLPLAVLGLIVGLWQSRPRLRALDDRQRSLVLWGVWLLTTGVFFSIALFYHTYYLVMIAPAIAALGGIALTSLWAEYRRAESRLWLLFPLSLAGVAGGQIHILQAYPAWSRWLDPLVVAACGLAALLLILVRVRPFTSVRLAVPAALLAVVGLLAAPAAFAAETAQHPATGNIVRAGPSATGVSSGFGGPGGSFGGGSGGPPGAGVSGYPMQFGPLGTTGSTNSAVVPRLSSTPTSGSSASSSSTAPGAVTAPTCTTSPTPPGGIQGKSGSTSKTGSGTTPPANAGTPPNGSAPGGSPPSGSPPSGSPPSGATGGPPPGSSGEGGPPAGAPPSNQGSSTSSGSGSASTKPPTGTRGGSSAAATCSLGTTPAKQSNAKDRRGRNAVHHRLHVDRLAHCAVRRGAATSGAFGPPSGVTGGSTAQGQPGGQGGPGGGTVSSALVKFLLKHQGNSKYLVVTTSSMEAAPLIIDTGKPVMALGGFSGSDPILTTAQFAALVKAGTVRYVMLGGMGGGQGGPGGGSSSISTWVTSSCKAVPTATYSSGSTTGASGGASDLYDCGGVK